MLYHEQSEDYRPLFWMQDRPVYANTLILSFHIAAFVAAALAIAYFGYDTVFLHLCLAPSAVWSGEVWRIFSYITFDPNFFSQRSLWFFISILMLYFFGREVEQFVGRRTYLKLYAALVIIPAVLLCLVSFGFMPRLYLNCCDVFFGIYVAFATIYPGVMPSGWLPLTSRALMWILLGISSLIDLAMHDYTAIFMLGSCSLVAYVAMRLAGAGQGMLWLTDWLENRRALRLERTRNFKIVREQKATESIDAILEKISQHGVGSLDASEKAALERARAHLLKRDQS